MMYVIRRMPARMVALVATATIATALSAEPRRLNNFVTELLDEQAPAAGTFEFDMPAEGWLFVRILSGQEGAALRLDGIADPVLEYGPSDEGTREAMRYLPAGTVKLTLTGRKVGRLQARKVPEIYYNKFQYDPWVHQEGPFDWEFLQGCMLPHVNTIIGIRNEDQSRWAHTWRARGGRWMIETLAPGLQFGRHGFVEDKQITPVEEIVTQLTEAVDYAQPWIDGQLIDEYYPSLEPLFENTLEAIRRIHEDPRYAGKRIDLYVASDPESMAEFVKQAIALGSKIVMESYNAEKRTESEARTFLHDRLVKRVNGFREYIPEIEKHLIVCLGMYSSPPESLNVFPHVNYRVYQDMEFHLLANDPAFDGLFGINEYTTGYADRETIQWVGRLYRHYCIEGCTERLTAEPYELDHIVNPDFEDGLEGWNISEAEPGSVSTRQFKDLGHLQARFGHANAGDQCLVMRRSPRAPNVVRQQIRNLVPGRLYTARMYSTNLIHRPGGYGNPGYDDIHTVHVRIEDAKVIPEESYQHTYRSIHTRGLMFFNYHVARFQAMGETAEIVISDWAALDRRAANPYRESGVNFVEVQKHLPIEANLVSASPDQTVR